MKTLPAIIATSILLASVGAHASYDTRTSSASIPTNVAATKAEAYEMGVNKLASLQSIPEYELGITVPSGNYTDLRVEDGGNITTKEIRSADGSTGYVGMVNFNFSFTDIDD